MTINFDLNDNPLVGPDPITPGILRNRANLGDGKLRVVELLHRVEEAPWCLFDMSGKLTAGLDAFLWIGLDLGLTKITLFDKRFSLFKATLFDFNLRCQGAVPPILADQTNVAMSNIIRTQPPNGGNPVYYQNFSDGILRLNIGSRASDRTAGQWRRC